MNPYPASNTNDYIRWGVYCCERCGEEYTVNEITSWRLCTPTLCHDCYEYFQWVASQHDR